MAGASSGDLTILKLGGSVITDKDAPETVDDAALDSVVSAIADSESVAGEGDAANLIIVHGGGSFGHVHAAEHGVSTTEGTHDLEAVTAIHGAMKRLNGVVIDRLQAAGVPAVPVHPLSAVARDADAELSLPTGAVDGLRTEGFVPVLHGDVIAHAGQGVTVLSGDELVTGLAERLGASRVGLCSTVPGVLDSDGDVIDAITDFESVAAALGDSESTDVSGGMAGKVRELLALSGQARIFGPDGVGPFLAGDAPGTLID
ncbi:isopentenyl phosphate kinase family protein [Halonotius terrestris]|uniref:Isopentenyl phosphate kinase n=1 Tax=Halonotius terrestris TaxID=2487750 RepID=A0A8J8P828_9EURY|nr:isopentenyl phosphate kinase [Halonotius terrestris]TQQ79952.1 isopentenyl phosphate kinase family protein [Halonotius terrestris]